MRPLDIRRGGRPKVRAHVDQVALAVEPLNVDHGLTELFGVNTGLG